MPCAAWRRGGGALFECLPKGAQALQSMWRTCLLDARPPLFARYPSLSNDVGEEASPLICFF